MPHPRWCALPAQGWIVGSEHGGLLRFCRIITNHKAFSFKPLCRFLCLRCTPGVKRPITPETLWADEIVIRDRPFPPRENPSPRRCRLSRSPFVMPPLPDPRRQLRTQQVGRRHRDNYSGISPVEPLCQPEDMQQPVKQLLHRSRSLSTAGADACFLVSAVSRSENPTLLPWGEGVPQRRVRGLLPLAFPYFLLPTARFPHFR